MEHQGLLPFFLLQICQGGMFTQVLLAGDRFGIPPQLGNTFLNFIYRFIFRSSSPSPVPNWNF